ncbi:DUF5955 family protein [Streptomyces sp. MS19]|uniref:DUF5955 family protein n=1 Tax=Streptomyces sp. MS19 TaxID=3385972 RepID=UPI0039A389ED
MAAGEAETARTALTGAQRGSAAGTDPRIAGLQSAVRRLRTDLDRYPAPLADREIAERALDALDVLAVAGPCEPGELRESLLMIVAAVGSVSALARGVAALREALEMFGVSRAATLPYGFPQRRESPSAAWPPPGFR